MPPQPSDIDLVYEDRVPTQVINEFHDQVATDGLRLGLQSRPTGGGPFLGLEWLLPTAVMLFISRSYFDGFLAEMGSDHYRALKGAIKTFRDRFSRVKVTVVGTAGKTVPDQPYSLVYSIWLEAGPDRGFKFLVPNLPPGDEADVAWSGLRVPASLLCRRPDPGTCRAPKQCAGDRAGDGFGLQP